MNCSVFYRLAEEETERMSALPNSFDDTFAAGAVWGAMAAFGLMGMAHSIHDREAAKQRQRDHEDRMLEADMGQ